MVDFLFALIEPFSLSVTVPKYEAKCVQLGCFRRGSRPYFFALKFYLDRVIPEQPFLASEN